MEHGQQAGSACRRMFEVLQWFDGSSIVLLTLSMRQAFQANGQALRTTLADSKLDLVAMGKEDHAHGIRQQSPHII